MELASGIDFAFFVVQNCSLSQMKSWITNSNGGRGGGGSSGGWNLLFHLFMSIILGDFSF